MTLVYDSGFLIDCTQGASSLAQGAATIAHSDYASAIFFNPALLNKLEGTQIEIGTTLFFPSIKFESDITGKTSRIKTEIDYAGTFFITHPIGLLMARMGIIGRSLTASWSSKLYTT